MVVLLRLKWPVVGSRVVGAVALFEVPPQAARLVHPFAFAFALPEDLAGHDTIFVGSGLEFVWSPFSRRWQGGMLSRGQRRRAQEWSHGVCNNTDDPGYGGRGRVPGRCFRTKLALGRYPGFCLDGEF